MRLRKYTRVAIIVLVFYILLSAYAAYHLFKDYGHEGVSSHATQNAVVASWLAPSATMRPPWDFSLDDDHQPDPPDLEEEIRYVVEVWGKAAIGQYLWEHILRGELVPKMGGVWSFGSKQVHEVLFQYRTGPGVVPQKVPHDVENVVLVLNGREPSKIRQAKLWLDYLPQYKLLRNTAVVILGNEQCDNEWLKPYLASRGGRVQFVFVVYDSPDVDDYNFYQWPLGVATYRDFPHVDISQINLLRKRHFKCNFLGTIYPNSSRSQLLEELERPELQEKCYVKPRKEWWPEETAESLTEYMQALQQSDLTLCPVGMNAECYRVYEALSYGSIPVIENRVTPGGCRNTSNTPLTLLKQYHAPVLYVNSWKNVRMLIDKETEADKIINRRQNVAKWYIYFKQKMKEKFVGIIRQRFFGIRV